MYVAAPRPAVPGLPVSLPPRPDVLAGRDDLLADLHARLSVPGGPRVVALHGMGGAGKSSVAVEYAHRHLAEVGVAWQLPAEDPMVLRAEFGRLAVMLGASDGLDARDPVAAVHAVLAVRRERWLLIFDNAEDHAAVRPFLPPGGTGQVLVTTQSGLWPAGQAVRVPVLDLEDSAAFLMARSGDDDGSSAASLAEALDGLPLALEQAAAYVQATAGSLAGYLDVFRRRRAELLARGEPAAYGKTVATTWALAFSRLDEIEPRATGLLRLLSCLPPEPVPLRLLLESRDLAGGEPHLDVPPQIADLAGDSLALGDAVAALRRFSLITPARDGLFLVHRLVQAVTIDQMPAGLAARYRQAAAALVLAAIPIGTDSPQTWPACTALLPHALAILPPDSTGLDQITSYLGHSGNYGAARDLCQNIASARDRQHGPAHPDTLTARSNLAYWTAMAGDAAAARDEYAALVPDMDRILGPGHPGTLKARERLASAIGQAGNPATARDQYAVLLPNQVRVLGPDHRDTLTTRGNLASWTGQAGHPATARDQYAALLAEVERVLGPDHPDTLATRHNLASWTGQAGHPAAARDQYAALLPDQARVMGPDHPDTLTTRGNLASWTGQAGDPATARDQYAALLPDILRVLGPDHPDTLATRHNLAKFTGLASDSIATARDQYAALLPDMLRVLGPDHPDTLATRLNLAVATAQAGNFVAARRQLTVVLPILKRVLGARHPTTVQAQQTLGMLHQASLKGLPGRKIDFKFQ